jgi:hypothetical protein
VKLTDAEARVVLLTELVWRASGRAATWGELRRGLGGLDRAGFAPMMFSLRKRGALTFTDDPRSLRATGDGVTAAARARHPKRRTA